MYKLFTTTVLSTCLLSIYTSSLQAKNNDTKITPQMQHDIELVEHFKAIEITQAEKAATGGFITVGGDVFGCHFNNIQDAIDSVPIGGTEYIRIASNNTYNENLVIGDINVSLIGGYTSCLDASDPFPPSSNQILIDGGNNAPVLEINGNSQRTSVSLKNLRFIEGLGQALNGGSAGGGILAYDANVALSLDNVDIRSNDAEYGAGIAMIGGNTDVLMQDSRVANNLAEYGAGIYCQGGGASIIMVEDSAVFANVANGTPGANFGFAKSGRGGGLYLDSCDFSLYSGSANGGTRGVSANFAYGAGGGIFASRDSSVLLNGHQVCNGQTCIGDDTNPVSLTGNRAGLIFNISGFQAGTGGAIESRDSSITIYAGRIQDNSAFGAGGGIHLLESSLTVDRLHKACWSQDHCNYFVDNFTIDGSITRGGAIYNKNSNTYIFGAVIENNTAVIGAAIYNTGFHTITDRLRVESSLFINNGDSTQTESIIYNTDLVDITLIHSTIADNHLTSDNSAAIIRSTNDPIFGVGLPTLTIYSSIIHNPGFNVFNHNSNSDYEVDISCMLLNESTTLSAANDIINEADGNPGGARIITGNPIFLDPTNSNYNIAGNSPAIDYCFTPSNATSRGRDLQFEEQGYRDPLIVGPTPFFFYDMGADETYLNDTIFFDDFD